MSRCQKGKTNLDFTETRDSEWQWHQLGYMQVCTLLQTDNHANTSPVSFLQAGCPSCRPTKSVKALKARTKSSSSCNIKTNSISNLLLGHMLKWMQQCNKCSTLTFCVVTDCKFCTSFRCKKLLQHHACSTNNIHPDTNKSNYSYQPNTLKSQLGL